MVVLRQNLQASPPVEKSSIKIHKLGKIKMMLRILPGRDDVLRRPGLAWTNKTDPDCGSELRSRLWTEPFQPLEVHPILFVLV